MCTGQCVEYVTSQGIGHSLCIFADIKSDIENIRIGGYRNDRKVNVDYTKVTLVKIYNCLYFNEKLIF